MYIKDLAICFVQSRGKSLIKITGSRNLFLILPLAVMLVLASSNVLQVGAAPVFTHGVASGDVTSTSAILWARVNQDAVLNVWVTPDPNFSINDFKGSARATIANDYTAKVSVKGLIPNKNYLYRWTSGGPLDSPSEMGQFKTAPLNPQPVDVHFSWSGDTDVTKIGGVPYFGNWLGLQSAISGNPDFFIYLGDVIYSDNRADGYKPVASNVKPQDVTTLDGFRQLYKDSRNVVPLRTLMERTSIFPVWDDHDVRNDWAGQKVDKTIYEIGKKSFNEYMPIQEPWLASDPYCAGPTQFRVKQWGKDVDLIFLDTRSCRSENAKIVCGGDLLPTLPDSARQKFGLINAPPAGCRDKIKDPNSTMLGATQKTMFKNALLNSKAKFKFVITSVSMQQTFAFPYDRWEGYASERSEILNFIKNYNIKNVIFLTTDSHLNLMNEVFIDQFTNPTPMAYEFVTGPIAALTDKNNLMLQGGLDFVKAKETILRSISGADCFNLDKYSFGDVSINKVNGLATITLKDEKGIPITDELNPTIRCTKTLGLAP